MIDATMTLIILGGLFLLGSLTEAAGRHTHLPRVTILLLLGILIGSEVLGLLPERGENWLPLVSNMALAMVGFLLGGKLTGSNLKEFGRFAFWISISVVVVTMAMVTAALTLIGVAPGLALLLGAISTATAPAATVDVVQETEAEGLFTRTLLGIVALDDAWGLILFSMAMAVAHALSSHGIVTEYVLLGAREIGGACLLGVGLGIPMAFLTGRIRPGQPTLVEALGLVFLCGGLALRLDVSLIMAAIVMGVVVTNLARHHDFPFHAIEDIEWPFLILFFILAGTSLKLPALLKIGVIGIIYIITRIMGRMIGSQVGGFFSRAGKSMRNWMGIAMLPQAGVAMGMALLAVQRFPDFADTILPLVIGATVFFELLGPVFTRIALNRVGEIQPIKAQDESSGYRNNRPDSGIN